MKNLLAPTLRHTLLFNLFIILGLFSNCNKLEDADLLIYNATIYTVDQQMSIQKAMAIKNGKILELGDFETLNKKYKATESLDLEGQFVYPGFNDAHAHFHGYARGLHSAYLVGTKSFNDIIDKVLDFHEEYPEDFILGIGWDQNDWEIKEFPNKDTLDVLFPSTPVYLYRIDGHAALANQAALDLANITAETKVQGGIVELKEGQPTGILIDNAMNLMSIPRLERSKMIELLIKAEQNLFEVGLTSITDAGLNPYEINLIDSLQKEGLLKLRMNIMVSESPKNLDYYLNNGPIEKERLRVKSFKFYLDGALGSHGALLLKTYTDDQLNYGLQLKDKEHYVASAKKIKAAGWQMCTHAIGDSANRLILDIYEEALAGSIDNRWRIEHSQIVHKNDIDRFGKLGIIPSVQPTHATSDMYWADERLGEDRLSEAYPYQSLLNSTGILALGTDFPVEDINPLKTYRAAVFRQDSNGYPEEGFMPKEKISKETALKGMTVWAAYTSFEENLKGSLEAGKLADFVILNKDILAIESAVDFDIQVVKTFVNGEEVFSNN